MNGAKCSRSRAWARGKGGSCRCVGGEGAKTQGFGRILSSPGLQAGRDKRNRSEQMGGEPKPSPRESSARWDTVAGLNRTHG